MGCGYQGGKRMFADFVDALIGSLLSMSGMDIAKMLVMWAIGGVLIYLAIKKDMEPSLLLPMGLAPFW